MGGRNGRGAGETKGRLPEIRRRARGRATRSARPAHLKPPCLKPPSLPPSHTQIAWRGHKSVVSWHPRIFTLHSFLSPAECAYLIEKAKPYMEVSTVVDNASGKSLPSTVRTSDGLFLDKGEDAVVLAIERRIALATDLPIENGEGMQVRKKRGERERDGERGRLERGE